MSSTKPESILLEKSTDVVPDVANVYCMGNMDLVFSALESEYVDAAAGHETVMRQYMDTMPDNYRLLDNALQSVKVGVAFYKESTDEVIGDLKDTLEEMKADGTLQSILESYEISSGDVTSDENGGEE
jgi:ABC-type amino acid transport substrate-binding protein